MIYDRIFTDTDTSLPNYVANITEPSVSASTPISCCLFSRGAEVGVSSISKPHAVALKSDDITAVVGSNRKTLGCNGRFDDGEIIPFSNAIPVVMDNEVFQETSKRRFTDLERVDPTLCSTLLEPLVPQVKEESLLTQLCNALGSFCEFRHVTQRCSTMVFNIHLICTALLIS